jgi:hypothetical protein
MAELFDDITRIVGSNISRRRALTFIMDAVIGGSVAALWPVRAKAQTSCCLQPFPWVKATTLPHKIIPVPGGQRYGRLGERALHFAACAWRIVENTQNVVCPEGCPNLSIVTIDCKFEWRPELHAYFCEIISAIYICCPTGFTGVTGVGQTECCPNNRACNNHKVCCPDGQICCGGVKCCPPARCAGNVCCPPNKACGNKCCATSQTCCGGTNCCYTNTTTCIGGQCCPQGKVCGNACCASNQICCHGVCCYTANCTSTGCNGNPGSGGPSNSRPSPGGQPPVKKTPRRPRVIPNP